MTKLALRTEYVTAGTETIGTIRVTARGCECFGPLDQYLATYPTIEGARRALFELHRDGEKGPAKA